MSHDKIKAATRQRMAETGEPYSVARRAVISEHKQADEKTAGNATSSTPDRIRAEMSAEVGMMSIPTGGAMETAMANLARALEQAGRISASIPDLTAFERAATSAEWAVTENVIRMIDHADRIADKANASIAASTAFERVTTAKIARAAEQVDRLTATHLVSLDGAVRALEQTAKINETISRMGWV